MDLYSKLSSNMENMEKTFDSRLKQIESDIKKCSNGDPAGHSDLEALSKDFTEFKLFIWKSMAMMRTQLELFFQGLDHLETASRRKVLLFHGITESPEISTEDKILQLFNNTFKMSTFSLDQISVCHRLGTNSKKPRPIMVRFIDYKHRNAVWNSKTLLKNSGITVSEFLTKTRHDIFIAARKHFGMRRCWTSDGRIIILLPDNKRRKIESLTELKLLISEFPQEQVTEDKTSSSTAQGKNKNVCEPTAKPSKNEPKLRRHK